MSRISGRLRSCLARMPSPSDGSRGFDTQITSASIRSATASIASRCSGNDRPSK